ncbi:class I adenylate-forming enzyme family protein [Pseudooceanicola aestuarii]|uniref:class I adenylate-forming enzyme family protein n=1 Tax=Pseudooceanicola aestuarii TaxID=2697319 RepID=UPI0013D79D54|nr:class I adenylate-forming enzyme family protein [Pseudooceanicola aestuarii]
MTMAREAVDFDPGQAPDLHATLMAVRGGGIQDDHGWLPIAGLQQLAEETQCALLAAGLTPAEPVMVPVSGRAEDVAAIMAVLGARGTAVPVHRKAHARTQADLQDATGARFAVVPVDVPGRHRPAIERIAEQAPPHRPLLDGAGMITFTSGSTGRAKGVVLSRDRISAKMQAIRTMLDMPPAPEAIVPLQLPFSFGQWATFVPLMQGGIVHMTARFDPATVLRVMEARPVTHLAAVPTMLRRLAQEGRGRTGGAFTILTGGEPVPADLRDALFARWPDAVIDAIYGLTESGTCDLLRRDRAGDTGDSLGHPTPGVQVATDPQTGELRLRSPFAMLGYLDQPDLTAQTLRDGWLSTGDVGEIAQDGSVRLRGRIKELINRGGNKVSPLEVEATFATHPDVGAVLATGLPDPRMGEAIHLLVVPRAGRAPDAAALLDWARGRTDRFKLPDAVHFGTSLPLGNTGKADRAALRRQIMGQAATAPAAPARGQAEGQIPQ